MTLSVMILADQPRRITPNLMTLAAISSTLRVGTIASQERRRSSRQGPSELMMTPMQVVF